MNDKRLWFGVEWMSGGTGPASVVMVLFMLAAGSVGAATLLIHANTSDPAPKTAFQQLIDDFQTQYPDIDVQLRTYDHEAFKPAIRQFLMFDAPDVVTWFAGNRMRFFVDRGLFEDVSDVWKDNGLYDAMATSRAVMTVDGRQYGVPYTYYQWGVYYRKDLFEQYGLAAPATWDEFLAVCQTLKENGITPITIGTKPLWPAAGWFDYLDLRINGLPFHRDLTAGTIPYTDERVRRVFSYWRTLLDSGYFVEDHGRLAWQDAITFLSRGQAAMYLIGNFITPFLEETGLIDKMGFFPFPTIDPAIPPYEDAPIDTVHIPSGARNKTDARRFLAFIARADNQSGMNRILRQLPVNLNAELPEGSFLGAGRVLLSEAKGLAQFYDRDTTPEMAQIGMLGFRKFMDEPDRLDFILERLELQRRRIYEIRLPPDKP